MAKKIISIKRPYATDYGLTKGHCATQKSALKAAVCYLVDNDQKRCTIEGPDGKAVARVEHYGVWGVIVSSVRGGSTVVPFRRRA